MHREHYSQGKMLNMKGKTLRLAEGTGSAYFMTFSQGRMSLKRHKKLHDKERLINFKHTQIQNFCNSKNIFLNQEKYYKLQEGIFNTQKQFPAHIKNFYKKKKMQTTQFLNKWAKT